MITNEGITPSKLGAAAFLRHQLWLLAHAGHTRLRTSSTRAKA